MDFGESGASIPLAEYQLLPLSISASGWPDCLNIFLPKMSNGSEDTVINTKRAELIALDSVTYPEYQYMSTWLARRRLYKTLHNDSVSRTTNPVLGGFYTDMATTSAALLRHSEELFALLSDTAYIHDSAQQAIWLAKASDTLDSAGSDPALQVQNLVAIGEIYVRWHEDGVDSLDSIQKAFIYYLAPRCPLVDGPGVYRARTLVAALGSVNSTI